MHSFCIDNSGYSRSFALRVDRDFEMVAEASDGVKKPIQLAQHTQSAVILLRTAGLNGHEVARQILSVLRKTKVLFVVNRSDIDIVTAALQNGPAAMCTTSRPAHVSEKSLRDSKTACTLADVEAVTVIFTSATVVTESLRSMLPSLARTSGNGAHGRLTLRGCGAEANQQR